MTSHPAAPLQSAMLVAARVRPGAYVQQVELDFPAGGDAARIGPAFGELAPRFPALCQEFSQTHNGAYRVTLAAAPRVSVREEAGPPPAGQAWVELLAADRAEEVTGHRLRLWPSARRGLWTFSHALLDGRSTAQVVRAWVDTSSGRGGDAGLAWKPWEPLPPETAARTAQAWAKLFPLETDDPPPAREAYHSALRFVEIEADTLAAAWGVTVHTLAQATAALVVGRVVDQPSVVVGQVRACGPADTAGLWINTVPQVLAWASTEPIRALALRAREASRSLRAVARIAPDQWLPIVRPQTRRPWDAVLMSERGTLDEIVARPDARITLHERSEDPLILAAYLGRAPRIQVESTSLPPRTVEWLADTWKELLETLARQPEATCEPRFRTAVSPVSAPVPPALYPAFADAVRHHAARPAASSHGHTVTYEQLALDADRLAAALLGVGVAPRDRVAVRLSERQLLPVALLATQRLGAVFVPLDPDHPHARLDGLWNHSTPRLLLSDRAPWRADLPHLDPRLLPAVAGERLASVPPPAPDGLAALLYTSGSTGEPKGVRLLGGAIATEARAVGHLIGITTEDRVLQFASPGFDAFLEEVFLALLHGAALVPRDPGALSDFGAFTEFLRRERVSVADLPTAFWRGWTLWLARHPERFPERLRCVIIGGEAATEAALGGWRTVAPGNCQLWNTYGPTETTIVATAYPLPRWPAGRPGDPPIGRPLAGVSVRVAGRDGTPRPPGLAGELWISGWGVSPGYWQRPDLDSAFVNRDDQRWYRTGDCAAWSEEGDLVFLGRTDDQIKLRGHRIEPDEIRRHAERIPGVHAAHVALSGEPPMLVAWIVAQHRDAGLAERVQQVLAATLPAALIPSAVIPVEALPLTSRGKVDRARLPAPTAVAAVVAADDPMTAWACRVFAEVLRRPLAEVDPDRDFQRQGGDSISAMELALRLREAGLVIEPGELACASSPRAIARRFSHPAVAAPDRWEPIVVLRPGRPATPPLVLIHATPGDVLGYGNLAAELPDELPCWGLVSRALHEPQHPHHLIPDMAVDYLDALQERLGDAPFALGGWCYGGLVAYEMACALHRARRPPPLRLLLIETWCPLPAAPARALRLRLQQARTLFRLPPARLLAYLRHKFNAPRLKAADPTPSTSRRDATLAHNLAAAQRYRAGPYPLAVELLFTPDPGADTLPLPEGGWSVLAADRTVHLCGGGHADLLHPPHAAQLAARIAALLASPDRTPAARHSMSA